MQLLLKPGHKQCWTYQATDRKSGKKCKIISRFMYKEELNSLFLLNCYRINITNQKKTKVLAKSFLAIPNFSGFPLGKRVTSGQGCNPPGHGLRRRKRAPRAPPEALRPVPMHWTDRGSPPNMQICFLGGAIGFMTLKMLRCCGDASLLQKMSILRVIGPISPPKNIRLLGGLSPINPKCWRERLAFALGQ